MSNHKLLFLACGYMRYDMKSGWPCGCWSRERFKDSISFRIYFSVWAPGKAASQQQQRARSIIHAIILASSNLCYRARVVNSSLRVCYCVQGREIPFLFIFFNSREENNKFHTAAVFGAGALLLLLKYARENKRKTGQAFNASNFPRFA